ncbi:MAG: MotA/TolQ/ExbB proton channel family protein [Desulfocapsaceae bacterium]|nr:MotA/TolQ/ExbB proton channel family protein [Desulfocapsaceae bacterium]
MKQKNLIGLLLAGGLFILGFLLNGNVGLYFNFSGFIVVISGTTVATLLSFRIEQLRIALKVVMASYRKPVKTETEIINILIDLSIKSRMEGILSLQDEEQETSILFLRRALSCLVDGYRAEQIREILNTEMYFFKLRREDLERVLRTIGEFFPVFGLIGSIIGWVTMLGGVGSSLIILKAVPIALTATLYGLIFANFIFLPLAANLKERTNKELLLQKIIMEGVIAIDSELNPVILTTKLESFLTPSERNSDLVSYAKIKERFNIQASEKEHEERHEKIRQEKSETENLNAIRIER